eukprot:255475-Amorphochlora_amoeboformis.AAC.1
MDEHLVASPPVLVQVDGTEINLDRKELGEMQAIVEQQGGLSQSTSLLGKGGERASPDDNGVGVPK